MGTIIKKLGKTRVICIAAAVVLISVIALAACSSGGGKSRTLNVYNWGEYIDESILDDFTKETGITVNYSTFASNEEMYAKISRGGVSYDVAVPSDYIVERMIKEGLLEKIDYANIPNLQYIMDRFKKPAYDATGEYSVPYMWGTVGILYNTDFVDEPVDSWSILWDAKYKDQIFMYDSMRDTLGVALKKLGLSVNTRSGADLEAAKQALIDQKPLVRAYVTDPVRDSMIGNEGALAVVYSGDAIYCMENNDALGYVVPREGSNIWCDALVIPKGCKNKAEAEEFINFLCRPDVTLKNVEYIEYSTVNSATLDMMDEETRSNPAMNPPEDVVDRCEFFLDLGDFTNEYNNAWTEALSAN